MNNIQGLRVYDFELNTDEINMLNKKIEGTMKIYKILFWMFVTLIYIGVFWLLPPSIMDTLILHGIFLGCAALVCIAAFLANKAGYY